MEEHFIPIYELVIQQLKKALQLFSNSSASSITKLNEVQHSMVKWSIIIFYSLNKRKIQPNNPFISKPYHRLVQELSD